MDKVQRAGRQLQRFTLLIILLTPVAFAATAMLNGPLGLVRVPAEVVADSARTTMPGLLAVLAVGMLTPATYLLGLWFLFRLFGLYAKGIVFAEENVLTIRRAGYVLIAIDIVRALQSALTGPVLTAIGVTEGFLTIELQVSMLTVGLFVVLVSRIMDMGRELYENDQLTV